MATRQATMHGPNGQVKVVDVGSVEATQLGNLGWGLTPGSYGVLKLKALGLSDASIKNLDDGQRDMFLSLGEAITSQYNQNKNVPPVLSDADIQRITKEAQDDPNINAFYKEQLRIGADDFTKAVSSLNTDYQTAKAENERTMADQPKQLSEQEAAAGRAYSGFREQAKQKLSQDQMSVIQSSRSDLQKNLQTLGSSFEKTYGTTNLPATTVDTSVPGMNQPGTVAYQPTGEVAGTMEQQKLADIEALKTSKENAAITEQTYKPGEIAPATTPTKVAAKDSAPSTPGIAGSANFEKDLTHLGNTDKQKTMAGWGYKWTWTNKPNKIGKYVKG